MWRYRNVICPWQYSSEIWAQQKFLMKMEESLAEKGWTQKQIDELLCLHSEDRVWTPKDGVVFHL